MITVLDEKTRSAMSAHLGKNHNSSRVWAASLKAYKNTLTHSNPYFNADHVKIYPEKTKVLITPLDIMLMYFFQGGRCFYSGTTLDVEATIKESYALNGFSPNRKLNGVVNYFSPNNTVLVTQAVMRDKGDLTETSYRQKMSKSDFIPFHKDATTEMWVNTWNSELTLIIRSLGSLDHLSQVNSLIGELKKRRLISRV
jgi:hypothetical protein